MVGAESLDGRTRLTDRPIDNVAADLNSYDGDTLLARALKRARWSILWERLWPALATLATAAGLFLAVSWLGVWLMLPPHGRGLCAVPDGTGAQPNGRAPAARSQQQLAASARHHDLGRARSRQAGFVR